MPMILQLFVQMWYVIARNNWVKCRWKIWMEVRVVIWVIRCANPQGMV
jgi:hypothetical protein